MLKDTYATGTALTAAPFRGVYAGTYYYSSFTNGGSYGYYWSSTANYASHAYYLDFGSSYADAYSNIKNYGFSVRCVMRNPNAYNISYDKNTADSVADMPNAQVGDTANATITIPATAPTRDGYNFLGWCNAATTTTNGTDSCSGTTYNPNGGGTNRTIVLTPSTTTTVTLHAMWQRIQYTVTIALAGGASGVTIGGNSYTTSATLVPGNYTISGSYNSGYEFDSWATSGSISVASTSSASTTLTVTGAGTLTLNGKSSCIHTTITGTMQDFRPCSSIADGSKGTLTDSRDGKTYTAAKISGTIWMTKNLDLAGGTTLTPATSNVASNYTLPNSSKTFTTTTSAYVYNSGSTSCGNNSPCYSYYSFRAAAAGNNQSSGNTEYDICPKGWRLPTITEFRALKSSYSDGRYMNGSPWYGVYGGWYNANTGSFEGGGSYTYYWLSYSSSLTTASEFSIITNSSASNGFADKGSGIAVRCVAK